MEHEANAEESMARVEWLTEAGVRYLSVDYSRLDGPGMLDVLAEALTASRAEPGRYAMLVDVTEATMTSAWLQGIKDPSRELWGRQVSRCAVLGVSGIKAAMLRGFNAVGGGMRALPFRTRADALGWIAGATDT